MLLYIEMPVVAGCAVTECAYNEDGDCRARAITVGDGLDPRCDTYFPARRTHARAARTAGVGACKMTACRYNEGCECTAEEIRVVHHDGHADCETFEVA